MLACLLIAAPALALAAAFLPSEIAKVRAARSETVQQVARNR